MINLYFNKNLMKIVLAILLLFCGEIHIGFAVSITDLTKMPDNWDESYNKKIKSNIESRKVDPMEKDYYFKQAESFKNQIRAEVAVNNCTKALKRLPDDISIYELRSKLYMELNKPDKALADRNIIIKLAPNNPENYIRRNYYLTNYDDKIKNYNKAISLTRVPSSALIYGRAQLYELAGKYDTAIKNYDRYLQLEPRDFLRVCQNRSNIYEQQKKYLHAAIELDKAVSACPKYWKTYFNRGNYYARRGKRTLALSDYNYGIVLDPKNEQLYNARAELYEKNKQYDLAEVDYNKLINIYPNHSNSYWYRASFYTKIGKYNDALKDYNKYASMYKHATVYDKLADIYMKMGRNDLAIAEYDKAIASYPFYWGDYIKRGKVYKKLGQTNLMKKDFRMASTVKRTRTYERKALHNKLLELKREILSSLN